jgi:hypothetical protein
MLIDTYRFYCSRIMSLQKIEDAEARSEKITDLFKALKVWAEGKQDRRWACAAWSLCHSSSSKSNRAVFVFEIWKETILELLVEVYCSKSVELLPRVKSAEITLPPVLIPLLDPLLIPRKGSDDSDSKHALKTVSFVALADGVESSVLAKAITEKEIVVSPNPSRPLPALDAVGLDVHLGKDKVAEIADADVLNWSNRLDAEVIVNRNSVKLIYS